MEKKEIKSIIKKLYDAVEKSGWSAHKYVDTDWHNLYAIREVCNNVLPAGWRLICNNVFGYSHDNTTKDYQFVVENEVTGEQIIECFVRAYAAGRVDDVWSAYDCTAMFCVLGNVTKEEWED